jgi:glucose-6-phosphate-specific signal transduction histidine kinase
MTPVPPFLATIVKPLLFCLVFMSWALAGFVRTNRVQTSFVLIRCTLTRTDVMIFKKYFRQKNWRKHWRFLLKLLASSSSSYENLIITLFFFRKTPIFSPKIGENRRK